MNKLAICTMGLVYAFVASFLYHHFDPIGAIVFLGFGVGALNERLSQS